MPEEEMPSRDIQQNLRLRAAGAHDGLSYVWKEKTRWNETQHISAFAVLKRTIVGGNLHSASVAVILIKRFSAQKMMSYRICYIACSSSLMLSIAHINCYPSS